MSALPHRDVFGLVGTVIADRFRVERTLGEGGYGVVYGGMHLLLGVPVAIKCLKPAGFTPEEHARSAQAFLREARILFGLSHPAIVRLYDVGVIPDRHVPYAVLELLSGTTVAEEIARRAALRMHFNRNELAATFVPILEGVAFAHERGIIHRDLKPSNMMLVTEIDSTMRAASGASSRTRMLPKVLDFGTARVDAAHSAHSGSAMTTATGGVSGGQRTGFTPLYAAPEQWDRALGPMTARTDVFALGLTLAEACLLRYPFETSQGLLSIFKNALDERSRPLIAEARPDLPIELEHVILRALRVDAEARYPDARELLASFRAALRIAPTTAPLEKPLAPRQKSGAGAYRQPPAPAVTVPPRAADPRIPSSMTTMQPHAVGRPAPPATTPPRSGSALPWIVGSIGFGVALVAMGVAGVLVWRARSAPDEEELSSSARSDEVVDAAPSSQAAATAASADAGDEDEDKELADLLNLADLIADAGSTEPARSKGAKRTRGSGHIVIVGTTGEGPFWTQHEILGVAEAHKGELNHCVASTSDDPGMVFVTMTPDKHGVLERALCSTKEHRAEELCECLERTMSSWRYPPAHGKLGLLESASFVYTFRVAGRGATALPL